MEGDLLSHTRLNVKSKFERVWNWTRDSVRISQSKRWQARNDKAGRRRESIHYSPSKLQLRSLGSLCHVTGFTPAFDRLGKAIQLASWHLTPKNSVGPILSLLKQCVAKPASLKYWTCWIMGKIPKRTSRKEGGQLRISTEPCCNVYLGICPLKNQPLRELESISSPLAQRQRH